MPQLGESSTKPKKKKKDDAREIVSAYSPEGAERNKATKRKNILYFVLSLLLTLALVGVFAFFLFRS